MQQFRKARDKMRIKFAIPPSVSLQCIQVELQLLENTDASSNQKEQIERILHLFHLAVDDYSMDMTL